MTATTHPGPHRPRPVLERRVSYSHLETARPCARPNGEIDGGRTGQRERRCRALADNLVGRVIETLLRNDLIMCDELCVAPLDDTGAQLLFRFAAAYEHGLWASGSHRPFESWGRFLPEHTTVAVI